MKMNSDNFFEMHFSGADILSDTRAIDGTDVTPSFFADSLGGQGTAKKETPKDIEITVDCTLEELYNGSIKPVIYCRNIVKFDAKTLLTARCEQLVEVKPGSSEETVLSYKGMGNEQAGHPPSNLVIKFK